jgi:hypothetical protein
MCHRWPTETDFTQVVLTVEQETCSVCQRALTICDHRFHPIYTLAGPVEIVCKLTHCPDPDCPAHRHTQSPLAETQITLPWWLIGWDVFCWLGFRRFTRHWSVPQLQAELLDTYHIRLSDDAISGYLKRYRCMVAARHQDAQQLKEAYKDIDSLVLCIDGLQPEKGHETLYVVRELRGKRIWFAEALLSSSTDEVRKLLAKAKQWAEQLGKPVELWMSDKQDAFVQGIPLEFPGVPQRFCQNHFLRDLAKPILEADSHAKVQMRKKVRGLRQIEKQVLADRRKAEAEPAPAEAAAVSSTPVAEPARAAAVEAATTRPFTANTASNGEPAAVDPPAPQRAEEALPGGTGQVVLDYCSAVRGILNDDQGGPLHPPGIRMAEALQEVSESLQRNLEAKKGGAARSSCANSKDASTEGCKRLPRNNSRSKSTSRK